MTIPVVTSTADGVARPREMSLQRWIWRSYVRNALIPLLVIELLLVAVFLTSHAWSLRQNVAALREVATQAISRITNDEAAIIREQLGRVAAATEVLRRQATLALATPANSGRERERMRRQPSGALTTAQDDGGAAVFYSAATPIGPAQYERLARFAAIDPLLRDITESNPLVAQTYINTRDSMTRIWPWIDAAVQFDRNLDVTRFNFYYEADAARNPSRSIVWTDAYVDPAGKGWLVSAIAPVYRGDVLEAVVGADVTIARMVAAVLDKEILRQGFVILIGKDGTLLALLPRAEQLFDLRELTTHHCYDVIRADTFKPAEFNVFRRADFAAIANLVETESEGGGRLDGPKPHLVGWQTIPSIGWK